MFQVFSPHGFLQDSMKKNILHFLDDKAKAKLIPVQMAQILDCIVS